jgi:hypothetical protein
MVDQMQPAKYLFDNLWYQFNGPNQVMIWEQAFGFKLVFLS